MMGLLTGRVATYAVIGLSAALVIGIPATWMAAKWTTTVRLEAKFEAERQAQAAMTKKITEVVTRVVTIKDTSTTKKLEAALAKAKTENTRLQKRIADHAQALPALDTACAIPDGLRDDLNGALRGVELPPGPGDVDGAVPAGNPVPTDDGGQARHGEGVGGGDRGVPELPGAK